MITREERLPTSVAVLTQLLNTETDPARRRVISARIAKRSANRTPRSIAQFKAGGYTSVQALEALLPDATPVEAVAYQARIDQIRVQRRAEKAARRLAKVGS